MFSKLRNLKSSKSQKSPKENQQNRYHVLNEIVDLFDWVHVLISLDR